MSEEMGNVSWEKQKKIVGDPKVSPDFHLDFDKSASQERMHNPDAARKYLEELKERLETNPEDVREEIQETMKKLEQMLDDTTH